MPSCAARSINPPRPSVELIEARVKTVPAPSKSSCRIWFTKSTGLRRLRSTFCIPLRAGAGAMALYPETMGWMTCLSAMTLKSNTLRFIFSYGSFIANLDESRSFVPVLLQADKIRVAAVIAMNFDGFNFFMM